MGWRDLLQTHDEHFVLPWVSVLTFCEGGAAHVF